MCWFFYKLATENNIFVTLSNVAGFLSLCITAYPKKVQKVT